MNNYIQVINLGSIRLCYQRSSYPQISSVASASAAARLALITLIRI